MNITKYVIDRKTGKLLQLRNDVIYKNMGIAIADIALWKDYTCKQCNKPFKARITDKITAYCSIDCYQKHRIESTGQIILTCSFCGKKFKRKESNIHSQLSFCNKHCRINYLKNTYSFKKVY